MLNGERARAGGVGLKNFSWEYLGVNPAEVENNIKAELSLHFNSIREFEEKYSDRSVLPKDSALNFINFVLEDFGDEWVTKYMFHYRWHFKEDADNASSILPLNHKVDLTRIF